MQGNIIRTPVGMMATDFFIDRPHTIITGEIEGYAGWLRKAGSISNVTIFLTCEEANGNDAEENNFEVVHDEIILNE